jgi:hypothetical protein
VVALATITSLCGQRVVMRHDAGAAGLPAGRAIGEHTIQKI